MRKIEVYHSHPGVSQMRFPILAPLITPGEVLSDVELRASVAGEVCSVDRLRRVTATYHNCDHHRVLVVWRD